MQCRLRFPTRSVFLERRNGPLFGPTTPDALYRQGAVHARERQPIRFKLGGLYCWIDSRFPYIHCELCPEEIECGPLTLNSQLSNPYGGSEAHLSLFKSTLTQALVVNTKGQVISRVKLPAGVNGVHYYANAPRSTSTTINFDDLAAGTAVSSQYDAQGVDFDKGIIGNGVYCYPVIRQVSTADAQSGDQVADTSCANGEFSDSSIDGALKNNAQHVSVYAGFSVTPALRRPAKRSP